MERKKKIKDKLASREREGEKEKEPRVEEPNRRIKEPKMPKK